MSVAENMGFALKIAGVNKAEIRERVGEAAKLLDLEEFLDRRPKQLSGGQRQRVAMGRAIVRKPRVFLMDEPRGVDHAGPRPRGACRRPFRAAKGDCVTLRIREDVLHLFDTASGRRIEP
jgi:ABC-type taurine transport system ATPase subunit